MSEWKQTKIKNICQRIVSGGTPLRSKLEYYKDGNIPWLKTGEVKEGYIYETSEKITELGLTKSSAKLIPINSVIVAMYGETAGTVGINKIELATNQACCNLIVDAQLVDYRYLYFYLKGCYNNLVALKFGGAQQNLNAYTIKNFDLLLPTLNVQQKIAAILSAYDDLIENNTKRIALLEKAAAEIYREWFVRLRFPGHEGTRFERGMPKGWEMKQLKDLASTQYGFTTSATKEEIGPKFLRITDIVPQIIDWDNVPHCQMSDHELDKYLLHEGDLVIARTGTVGYAKRINKFHPNSVFASYLVRVKPDNPMHNIFLGLSVESDNFKKFIGMFVSGAAQPQANAKTMKLFSLLFPTNDLIERFNNLVEPMLDKKEMLYLQNSKLKKSRDLLLPRLISGKLSVEDLDIRFPASLLAAEAAV